MWWTINHIHINTCFDMSAKSLLVPKNRTMFSNCPPCTSINSQNTLSIINVHLLLPASISDASIIVERIRVGDDYINEVVVKERRTKYLLINRHTQKEGCKEFNQENVHLSVSNHYQLWAARPESVSNTFVYIRIAEQLRRARKQLSMSRERREV